MARANFCHLLQIATAVVVGIGIAWLTLISLFGPTEALPGGSMFALAAIFVAASVLGKISEVIGLPALLGSLVAGFALSNIPGIGLGQQLDPGLASAIRGVALVIILTRGGLGLDRTALVELSGPAARLALIPNLVEAGTTALVLCLALGWPAQWGLVAGFVLSAVSPAVVVPGLLRLQDEGFGVDKGIPTLIIAAASFDDVIAITGFGVCLSLAFSSGDPVWAGVKSPLELLGGAAYGGLAGTLAAALVPHRSAGGLAGGGVLLCLGIVAVIGGRLVDLGSGGALGVIVAGVVARAAWDDGGAVPFLRGLARWAAAWRCRACCCRGGRDSSGDAPPESAESSRVVEMASVSASGDETGVATVVRAAEPSSRAGTDAESGVAESPAEGVGSGEDAEEAPGDAEDAGDQGTAHQTAKWLKLVWTHGGQPALFGLIGAAVDVSVVDGSVLGVGIAALAAGLAVRCLAAYACLLGTNLTTSERLFLTAAWMPKATVQAAIGPVALDTAIALGAGDVAEARALTVLTLAVVAILLTAPAGAVLIERLGRTWLQRTAPRATGGDGKAVRSE